MPDNFYKLTFSDGRKPHYMVAIDEEDAKHNYREGIAFFQESINGWMGTHDSKRFRGLRIPELHEIKVKILEENTDLEYDHGRFTNLFPPIWRDSHTVSGRGIEGNVAKLQS